MGEYEKYFTKKDELNDLSERLSDPNNKIIVWGASWQGVQCIRLLEFFRNDLEIWDTFKAGRIVSRFEVKNPNLTKVAADSKKNIIVILAMGKKNRSECFELLKQAGYLNIEIVWDALEKLKIKRVQSTRAEYSKRNTDDRFLIDDELLCVFPDDCYSDAGTNMAKEYLVQDLWGAKKCSRPSRTFIMTLDRELTVSSRTC